MTNEPSPRPWHIAHPGEIEDANGDILYNLRYCIGGGVDEANAALIVAAVNERDRLRDELADKTRNYEDVIAHYQLTEKYLRCLIERLITVRQFVFWRKDEKTGMMYESCLMDEEEARKTVEEAKAAIGEDKK